MITNPGGSITIVELGGPSGCKTTSLGSDLAAGQALQHVVPPGTWFGAAPAEGTRWALVGCTVAPGERAGRPTALAPPAFLLHASDPLTTSC